MKNTTCITTKDPNVQLLIEAIRLREDFISIVGFERRGDFVEFIGSVDPEYKSFENIQKLIQFWNMRLKDKAVNMDLNKVLEQLKSE